MAGATIAPDKTFFDLQIDAFVMVMSYDKDEKDFFRMTPTIKFEDASGRKYKQTFCIDIGDRLGNGVIINYAQPELCEE